MRVARTTVPEAEVGATVPVPRHAPRMREPFSDPWRVKLTLPVWIPGISGTMAEGSSSFDPEGGDDFIDGITELNMALVGRIGVRKGRWALNLDGIAASIDQTVGLQGFPLGRGFAEGTITAAISRADLSYRFDDRCVGLFGRPTCLQTAVYAGARWYHVTVEVPRVLGARVDFYDKADWFDPIVGLRSAWHLSRKWSIRGEADFGGFTVGSQWAVAASASVEYRISRLFHVVLGYQYVGFKYAFERDGQPNRWRLNVRGPVLAFGLRF